MVSCSRSLTRPLDRVCRQPEWSKQCTSFCASLHRAVHKGTSRPTFAVQRLPPEHMKGRLEEVSSTEVWAVIFQIVGESERLPEGWENFLATVSPRVVQ